MHLLQPQMWGGGRCSGYTLATDSDFEWETSYPWNGAWHYIGLNNKVGIPAVISRGGSLQAEGVGSYRGMFSGTAVTGVSNDGSYVTDMSYMFKNHRATSLDFPCGLDTSNVTNMEGMFYNSSSTKLDLTSFDTSKVTNMRNMFRESRATTLDLSSFDTSNVRDMSYMFADCSATVVYVRSGEDINKFNRSGNIPLTIQFIVKQ